MKEQKNKMIKLLENNQEWKNIKMNQQKYLHDCVDLGEERR